MILIEKFKSSISALKCIKIRGSWSKLTVFKYILFWGMFFIWFSMMVYFYNFIIDSLSTFIYKVFIGFILGFFISWFIHKNKNSFIRLHERWNKKIINGIRIFICAILLILVRNYAMGGFGFESVLKALSDSLPEIIGEFGVVKIGTGSNINSSSFSFYF